MLALQSGNAACVQAQARLAKNPDNGRAFAIAQMSCGGQSNKVKVNVVNRVVQEDM